MANISRLCVTGVLLGAMPASALDLGLETGTYGTGVSVGYSLTEHSRLRAVVRRGSLSADRMGEGLAYRATMNFASESLLFEWHPERGQAFHVAAGIMQQRSSVAFTATMRNDSVTLGSNTYTREQLGTLKGTVRWPQRLAPYAGVGWRPTGYRPGGLYWMADIGVIYQGLPDVSLSADGTAAAEAALQSDLASKAGQLTSRMPDLRWLPHLAVGVQYRF